MSDQQDELQSRISRLEKKVERLEQKIAKNSASQKSESEATAPAERNTREQISDSDRSGWEGNIQFGEHWLNRIGIGLLLIGVAFLFKYSIDQGWLIPPVRSAIGLGIGVALFVGGLRMKENVKPLKQILLGGGIAVFYITGFATFQLYSFMSPAIIWSFMVIVTLLSLSLSLQQDEAVLSVVGTIGALGTPFMLYSGGGSVVMLILYTVLVLAGAIIVYMRKGWISLLWTVSLGGALVIFVGLVNTAYYDDSATMREQWTLQGGAIFWMICGWVLPVIRDVLSANDLSRWPDPAIEHNEAGDDLSFSPSSSVHLMTFIVPLLMLVMVMGNWDISMDGSGMVAVALAAAGSLFYPSLKNRGLPKLASTHMLLGLSMLTIGFVLMLEGNFLLVVLAAEAVVFRFIDYQTGDVKISISSHVLFGIVFLWILNMLYYSIGIESILDIESLSHLAIIIVGGTVVPTWLKKNDLKQIYQVTSHLLFLFWLYQMLSTTGADGQAWVTIAWGIYAILLVVWGFIRYNKGVRLVGMGTIFLVVGKLFLVDLSQLEAIWRILLFIGFGAVFLLLGYYWQSQWSDEDQQNGVIND